MTFFYRAGWKVQLCEADLKTALPRTFVTWEPASALPRLVKADVCRKRACFCSFYYRYGWLMLKASKLAGMIIDRMSSDDVDCPNIGGSASKQKCARRTSA